MPAALAIERLQGRLSEAMVANGLIDVSARVFNTHGESMGRGAHPSNIKDRFEWPMSPWASRPYRGDEKHIAGACISRDDVLEMFFTLRVEDGLAQLRRAFPTSFSSIGDFTVAEHNAYPNSSATGYAQIHREFIDPIARCYALSLRITTALANEFGAHG